ncbi:MAG TPA: D-aminoacyl-tRNA deacylase [Candidatus Nanoarchaeia archaeon]|nr:D-aminoacyl-tRNA deacylase [Candidatus Nanoarchaeia archaeon]
MKFAIITSIKDQAGINIHDSLVKNHGFSENGTLDGNSKYSLELKKNPVELLTVKKESVFEKDIDKRIDADYFIFATRHQSSSEAPAFTVHPIGNWGEAEMGGEAKKLCIAPSALMKISIQTLDEKAEEHKLKGTEVLFESTHHGPLLSKPVMFIEIGSSRKQWGDTNIGKIMADSIIASIEKFIAHIKSESRFKTAVGIGGIHYANNFMKIIRNTDIAMGHICPKYNLHNFNKALLFQAIEKTEKDSGETPGVIIDWKGLGDEKKNIRQLMDELKIEYRKTTDF